MHSTETKVPPADQLETYEIASLLCHRILPGATSTALLGEEWTHRHECGLPRSWLLQVHKAARRHRDIDDGTQHMEYYQYSDRELAESLSAKLDFELEVVDQAAEGTLGPILEAVYEGFRERQSPSDSTNHSGRASTITPNDPARERPSNERYMQE